MYGSILSISANCDAGIFLNSFNGIFFDRRISLNTSGKSNSLYRYFSSSSDSISISFPNCWYWILELLRMILLLLIKPNSDIDILGYSFI